MASQTTRHRPRAVTVLTTAFLAGAAAAVVLNQALDVHLSQRKPVVESEPIFVAMRSLPVGAPVTVWDVALRNWPKAMLPTQALRIGDSFEGMLLKKPLQEGQPLLSAQLMSALDRELSKGTSAVIGGSDGMVVVDDRTRVQVSWPAAVPPQPPVSPQPSTAATSTDITVAPASPVDAAPVAITAFAPAVPSPPTVSATEEERVAVTEADPLPPLTTLVSSSFASSTDLPPAAAEPIAEPAAQVIAEPAAQVIAEPAAQVIAQPAAQSVVQPEPSAVGGLVFPPAVDVVQDLSASLSAQQVAAAASAQPAPAVPAVQQAPSAATRHLVIPERIAVMIDEVTATDSMRTPAASETDPAMRPVTTRASTASSRVREPASPPRAIEPPQPAPTQPRTKTQSQAPGIQTTRPQAVRPQASRPQAARPDATRPQAAAPRNSLRKPSAEAAAAASRGSVPRQRPETHASPNRSQPPSSSRPSVDVRSKGVQDRQTQASPKASAEVPTAPETEQAGGGSMFPRVSARLEQVGEEFNRWRAGFGGDSSPK